MRKDVECTFGILKGRWRILKSGIRLSGVECADDIFLTCCALHNWLLEIDGLDKEWRHGIPSDWEGEIGEMPEDHATVLAAAAAAGRREVTTTSCPTTGCGSPGKTSTSV